MSSLAPNPAACLRDSHPTRGALALAVTLAGVVVLTRARAPAA